MSEDDIPESTEAQKMRWWADRPDRCVTDDCPARSIRVWGFPEVAASLEQGSKGKQCARWVPAERLRTAPVPFEKLFS